MPPRVIIPFKTIKKRDGRIVSFDQNRITNAVYRAMEASQEGDLQKDPQRVSDRVVRELMRRFSKEHVPAIEEIQDVVEETLILMDFPKVAKAYILYRSKRAEVREKEKLVPDRVKEFASESKKYFRNALAEFIYYRTYSRWVEEENRRETWIETVDRYLSFMRENVGNAIDEKEYAEIRDAIRSQEVMPSMRLMWSAGNAAQKTNVSAYNCSFIAPSKIEDFAEIMYLLMCGTGVGFSVESQTVQQLPIVKRQTGKKLKTYIIEDSKEGWGDALTFGLKAWFGGKDAAFDFSRLRPAGARLKTMGGRSSGPEPLKALLEFSRAKILDTQGRRLSNIDVHDIICKLGEVVVMGGVRRSALISLSDLSDEEMRTAKAGKFYLTNPQRMMANNSAAYNERPTTTKFLEEWLSLAESGSGERGIFNRGGLARQMPERRWKSFQKYWQTSGTNPCVSADTWIMTAEGARQVRDLIGVPFMAMVGGKQYSASGFYETGVKDIFEIHTRRGFSFKATKNHRVLTVSYKTRKTQRMTWKTVGELALGDRVVLHQHANAIWEGRGTEQEGWLLGSLIGDGNIEKNGKANLDYWGMTQLPMMQYAVAAVHKSVGARSDAVGHIAKTGYARVQSANLGYLAASYGLMWGNKQPTEEIERSSSDFYRGFLRGWFDADGSVQGTQKKGISIRLSANSLPSLRAAQRMLARLGVVSSIYQNRRDAGIRFLPNGRGGKRGYFCEADHELVVSKSNVEIFSGRIGFSDPLKNERLAKLLYSYRRRSNQEPFSASVTEIVSAGKESVYDCGVDEIHAFDGNGMYLHNCGEIILRSKQFCNLTEVVARAEDTEATLLKKMRIATILGTYQSTLTNFLYISKEWKKNCEEERLLGVSITGQWDCPAARNAKTLRKMRDRAIAVNREYAKRFGINPSTSITCVKPSGTVSQLVDASSGMHPRHAPYYIRRIRISATDPLFHMLKEQKFPYHPEVGQLESSATTYVLEFPVRSPQHAVFRNDLTALEQLEYWKLVKENYTEHNPSVTVSVGEEEWIETANWLYKHWDILGGLSFLPRSEHVYQLAPYEEVSKEQYEELAAKLPDIDFSHIVAYEEDDQTSGAKELACVGGVCEIDPEEESAPAQTPLPS